MPATKHYTNPILTGFYPDPSICRVGDNYYLVTSTFAYFPGIPVLHSKDLVHWTLIGHVINRPAQMEFSGLGVSKGIFAPSIRYHRGVFFITCTLVDGGGNFLVMARNPAGPWSDPVWLHDINGIDPSLFFDDDGTAYIIYNSIAPDNKPLYRGHRTIRMRGFDTNTLSMNGDEKILVNGGTDLSKHPCWIEGPHLLKNYGYYYLVAAEGGTGYDHSVVAFRSETISGPFIACPDNPVLTQRHMQGSQAWPITSTGHADLVELPNGAWQAVFLGCRPYEGDFYNTGRETFLVPVIWEDQWPRFNPNHDTVQYHYPLPLPATDSNTPYSGNFSYKDDFDKKELDAGWMFLRTPTEKWWDIEDGFISLRLRPETCAGRMNPSFLARRQQHLHCVVTISLHFNAAASHEKAGLLVFQNEDHFYYLCQSVHEGQCVVELYRSVLMPVDNCRMDLLARQILADINKPLLLRIEARGAHYSFYFSTDQQAWTLLKDDVDGKFLSTQIAGGFVGCTFALYATSLGKHSDNKVKYDWFEYRGEDEGWEQ